MILRAIIEIEFVNNQLELNCTTKNITPVVNPEHIANLLQTAHQFIKESYEQEHARRGKV